MILEQPELHLHPRVQAVLGDFLLSTAMAGVQCVIETHSEHLVNRLRYRAATMGPAAINAVKVYFVEREKGATRISELEINEYGSIVNWPLGFFDQSQIEADAIIRAALAKRSGPSPFPKR